MNEDVSTRFDEKQFKNWPSSLQWNHKMYGHIASKFKFRNYIDKLCSIENDYKTIK